MTVGQALSSLPQPFQPSGQANLTPTPSPSLSPPTDSAGEQAPFGCQREHFRIP
ncbi:hypothetical protein I79_004835 [Cricetulus griseus]|uniref:Uncharacterized protein n=1 Tax=Cricetulus griseus TaxID=10029 RepID=G3H3I8_CRIGR|nr:hypothetical protein I79_004835 [Cricetulus griseus]